MKRKILVRSIVIISFFSLLFICFNLVNRERVNSEELQLRTHYWKIDQEECNGCGACWKISPDCFEEDEEKNVAKFKCDGCSAGECSDTCGLFGTAGGFIDATEACPMSCIENVDGCD